MEEMPHGLDGPQSKEALALLVARDAARRIKPGQTLYAPFAATYAAAAVRPEPAAVLPAVLPTREERDQLIAQGGHKDDAGLARYDLIPPEALEALALLYARGAVKYADRNWEKGMTWGRPFAALMRHAWKWWRARLLGQDGTDPETGLSHMTAVAWNAFALMTFEARGVGTDDRPGLPHAPQGPQGRQAAP